MMQLRGIWWGGIGNKRHGIQKRKSSPDVVLVSILRFLNDELSVKQHKAAHDEQPEVHVCLSEYMKNMI